MEIIQRNNKFYLQLANGELELTEQQVKKRIERGDKFREYLRQLEQEESKPVVAFEDNPPETKTVVTSGKYFEDLIEEFENIYRISEDKPETLDKLVKYCKNAIHKLQQDKKNPKTDHIIIDYYILSWTKVIAHLESLPHKEQDIGKSEEIKQPFDLPFETSNSQPADPNQLVRQVLILQLMQADGLFPISNALQGISQSDIVKLMCNILNASEESIEEAIQESSFLLLKRNISLENKTKRIQLLESVEELFEQLPYPNIISRIKLLLKIYRE